MWLKNLFPILILIIYMIEKKQARCDFYTSITGLEDLLESEKYFLETFEDYLKQVKATNQGIIDFLDAVEANIETTRANPYAYFENPINAFKVLKRFSSDWLNFEEMILLDSNAAAYARNISQMNSLNYASATQGDLIGASKALARLQSTYALEAAEMAAGVLLNYEYNSTLSAHDCFELGCTLYDEKNIQYAGHWLLVSRLLLKNELNNIGVSASNRFPFLTDVMILEHLAPNMFDSGNKKMAKIFNEELLLQDPNNKYGLSNKELFENDLELFGVIDKGKDPKTIEPTVDDLYEAVCRGDVRKTPSEQRKLHCRYSSRNVPFCLLAPFKMEVLSQDPFVAVYYDAIYDSEMQQVISAAEDFVERSQIGDDEDATESDERTSKNTWLDYVDHEFLKPLQQRLRHITGLNLDYAEPLQVVNYGIGGHYLPHDDFSEYADQDYPSQGNRMLTALFYINDVELGGATAFPFLKLAVPPVRGSLLVWYNLHRSLEPDYRTRHAGCPVIKGSKWICNEWFHERGQELTRPCSIEQSGHTSERYKDQV